LASLEKSGKPRRIRRFTSPQWSRTLRISRHVDRAFFSFAWANPITRAQIETRAKTTAGIHKVSQSDLGSIILPLAPEEEQREISTVLVVAMNSAGSQRDQFTSALDLLATLDS